MTLNEQLWSSPSSAVRLMRITEDGRTWLELESTVRYSERGAVLRKTDARILAAILTEFTADIQEL